MPTSLPICLIPGDPDIAGIGVRISVYIQGCLSIFSSIYFLHTARLFFKEFREDNTNFPMENIGASSEATDTPDSKEDDLPRYIRAFEENRSGYSEISKALERSLFMVGFAVIVSAIIDAKSMAGITPYHLLIVLNLSQINHWAGFLLLRSQGGFIFEGVGWTQQLFPKVSLKNSVFCITHSCILSALGIYFWSDLKPFLVYTSASDKPCTPTTLFWSFRSIDASSNALRIISLVYYSLSVVPVLAMYIQNIMIEMIIGTVLLAVIVLYFVVCILLVVVVVAIYVAITISSIALCIALCIPTCVFGMCCCRTPSPKYKAPKVRSMNNYVGAIPSPLGHAQDIFSGMNQQSRTPNPFITVFTEAYFAAPLIYTIIATEMTIRANKNNVDSAAESKWTYGQTLALFTALIAFALYVNDLWKLVKKARKRARDLEEK